MSLTDLPIAEFEERTSSFLPQMKEDMCYPACLVNILNDLGKRMRLSLKFTIGEMNRLCDYREGMQCNEPAIPTIINDLIKPFNYSWKYRSGPELDIGFLKGLCEDRNLSLPIVRVAPIYFAEKGVRLTGRRRLDHSLIVMGVDHTTVYSYDPYETFYIRGRHKESLRRDMAQPAFLKAWDSSQEPRWVAWAAPRPTKQTRLPEASED